jgi:hypothetical protein
VSLPTSVLRIPKWAPLDWVVEYVIRTCVIPVGGNITIIDTVEHLILEIQGLHPDHPQIQGVKCDCTTYACYRCLGQGWVASWVPLTPAARGEICRSLVAIALDGA